MLKIGVIGFSDGNGHPYSWGAIFNGYQKTFMDDCGFPVISDYLSKRALPQETIHSAQVTHVWTQDIELSSHIAKAANIGTVCEQLDDMISEVDAFLLARDDWQSHIEFGPKLLASGKPVYIDKPIAVDRATLSELRKMQKYPGQIFSCSALRFSHQVRLTDEEKNQLGDIKYINCIVPKSWEKYSVHLIDPVVFLYAQDDSIVSIDHKSFDQLQQSQVVWKSGLVTNFTTVGSNVSKLQFDFVGSKGCKTVFWDDAFSCFKSALENFVYQIDSNGYVDEFEQYEKVVQIIEEGMK